MLILYIKYYIVHWFLQIQDSMNAGGLPHSRGSGIVAAWETKSGAQLIIYRNA